MPVEGHRSWSRLALAGVLVVALLVAGSVVLSRRGSPPSQGPGATSPPPSISPERLTFVARGPRTGLGVDNTDVFSALPDGSGLSNLTDDAAAVGYWVSWASDGMTVAYIRSEVAADASGRLGATSAIYVMDADGRHSRQVLPCRQAEPCEFRSLALSPDGTLLALVEDYRVEVPPNGFSPRSRLLIVTVANGATREIPCPLLRCSYGLADVEWSPDGRWIVFAASRSDVTLGFGVSPILVVRADGTGLRQLTNARCLPRENGVDQCSFDVGPRWSPDGSRIAFARTTRLRREILVMDAFGEHLRTTVSCDAGCFLGRPAWSLEGARLAFGQADPAGVIVATPDGGTNTFLAPSCAREDCGWPSRVVWSPDGSRLAFLGGPAEADLYVMSSGGTDTTLLAQDVECCLAWLPGARVSSLGTIPGAAVPTVEPLLLPGLIAYSADLASGDESQTGEIATIHSDGSGLVRLTQNSEFDGDPAWSPDGRRIAFGSLAGARNHNLFVMNADGTGRTRLTNFRYGAGDPTWSPDGSRIAFVSEGPEASLPDAVSDIFVMDADGANVTRITVGTSGDRDPAWSPDGQWIAFVRDEGLFLVHPDGSDLHLLVALPGAVGYPAWSPDGSLIAFSWFTSGESDLYVMDASGSDPRRITNLSGETDGPAWSPDGAYLAFTHGDLGRVDLEVVSGDGGQPWVVAPAGAETSSVSWQPTG